jgi:hypothetical protein
MAYESVAESKQVGYAVHLPDAARGKSCRVRERRGRRKLDARESEFGTGIATLVCFWNLKRGDSDCHNRCIAVRCAHESFDRTKPNKRDMI